MKRKISMDLLRCFALFCVVGVHFFRNSGFYNQPLVGETMYFLTLARTFFMICVPLFLMLTGFLMCKKTLSAKFYIGIIKTLCIYALASFLCYHYNSHLLGIPFDTKEFIYGLFCFGSAKYAWYVEMYIGVFLLIPFLNSAFNSLSRKGQGALVLTMIVMTSLVSVFNYKRELLPNFWVCLYPITDYFLGAYMREFKCKLPKWSLFLLLILCIFVSGTITFKRSYGGILFWGIWQEYYSFEVLCIAVVIFLLFKDAEFKRDNKFTRSVSFILKHLSNWTFGAYLLSQIFDDMFYPMLIEKYPDIFERMYYAPAIVLLVYFCSLALSSVLNLIYWIFEALFIRVKNRLFHKKISDV